MTVLLNARIPRTLTSLLETYLADGLLTVELMGRGYAWLDTGTHASLLDAGNFVRTLESRQETKIGAPEEVAWRMGLLDDAGLAARAEPLRKSGYGEYLLRLLDEGRG